MAIVRRERPDDAAAIRTVNELAFGSSTEADLVDALRARRQVRCPSWRSRRIASWGNSLQPAHGRAVDAMAEAEAVGELSLKGFSRPVPAFNVVRLTLPEAGGGFER